MKKTVQDYVLTAKAVAGFVFALVLFAASMYLSMALGWELADFTDLRWYALVIVRIFLFIALVMDVYPYLYQVILNDDYGLTHNRIQVYLAGVDHIERGHLMPELDKAVMQRNNDEFRKEANAMIHRVSRRINYEDIESEYAYDTEDGKHIDGWTAITKKQMKELIEERCGIFESETLPDKKVMKMDKRYHDMFKVLKDIKAGNVYIRELIADDIVNEGFINSIESDIAGTDVKKERNMRLAFTISRGAVAIALSAAIVITSVAFDSAVFGVIMALAIIFGAIASGASLAWSLATKVGYICEANSKIFKNYMGIDIKIDIPQKPVKEKKPRTVVYRDRSQEEEDNIL